MVILSVDYGDVRTGLAICDPGELLAFPFALITQPNPETLADEIANYASKKSVQMIVVGLPKNMDGSSGFRAEKSEQLAERLRELTGLPVEMWDERCTTVVANTYFNATDTRGKKRKAAVDKAAATIILEDFLNYRRNKRNREN